MASLFVIPWFCSREKKGLVSEPILCSVVFFNSLKIETMVVKVNDVNNATNVVIREVFFVIVK